MGHSDTHRRLHDFFNARRYGEIEARLAPEFMYEDLSRGLTVKTGEEFTDYLRGWTGSFSDATIGDPHYVEGLDHSVCTFHARGTNDGPLGDLPATGRGIDLVFCEVLHYASDSSVLSGEIHYDQQRLLIQLGHVDPPGAEDGPSPEQSVRDLFASFDRMDVDDMQRRFAPYGQGIDEISRRWLRRRDEVGDYLRGLAFAVTDVHSELRDVTTTRLGDTAITTLWLEQDYAMDGRPQHISAPTTVVTHRDQGRWKAVLVHSIPLPEESVGP